MSIGERIKQLRGTKSREVFGREFDKNRNTIQRYENDTNPPDGAFIAELCRSYKVSTDWLIYGKEGDSLVGLLLGEGAEEHSFSISDPDLAAIVERWEKLPDEARKNITSQVKELSLPEFLDAAKIKSLKEYSQERGEYIWNRGCKDTGLPGMFDTAAYKVLEYYCNKNIDDAALYAAAVEWAMNKLKVIQKVGKRNGVIKK
jgi:transcriptional regulator with XRE-family HTH domain